MFFYRITKYDPSQRDANGAFLPSDWTSVSDIGREIDGRTITRQHYLEVEDSYVAAAMQLLTGAGIRSMRVRDLEVRVDRKDDRFDDNRVVEMCRQVRDDMIVSGMELEAVIRGCLREYLWCRLSGTQDSYVHFGYDYYMYVGLPTAASGETPLKGVFLENVRSPYLTLDD